MKKILVFEMEEFFTLIKDIMKDVKIEEIRTNLKEESSDDELVSVDFLELKIKSQLGHGIKSITDIAPYSDIKKDIDEDYIIVSIELTDLVQAIGRATGHPIIESYEFFESNLGGDFKENIAFYLE